MGNGGLRGGGAGIPYEGTLGGPPGPPDPLNVPGLESDKKGLDPSSVIKGVEAPGNGAGKGVAANLGSPNFVGGFSSEHPLGAHFAFGDGSVRYLSQMMSPAVLQQLGHRADGKLPVEF